MARISGCLDRIWISSSPPRKANWSAPSTFDGGSFSLSYLSTSRARSESVSNPAIRRVLDSLQWSARLPRIREDRSGAWSRFVFSHRSGDARVRDELRVRQSGNKARIVVGYRHDLSVIFVCAFLVVSLLFFASCLRIFLSLSLSRQAVWLQ
jgi:hypothetical protein